MPDPKPDKLDYETPTKRNDAITWRQAAIAILALAALVTFLLVMLELFPQGG